jgi:chemotaxis protein methyltransferase CheR
MVQFEVLNLKDAFAAKRHGTWDLIFCRNCMIYFDQEMRNTCLQTFYDQLAMDGYLFIGHSESLQGSEIFDPLPQPQAFAYTRATPGRRNARRTLNDGTSNMILTAAGIKAG